MWEEIESTHARVYTTYGIQRHAKNQRSIPRIDNGAEEVGNLNVLRHWRVKEWNTGIWVQYSPFKKLIVFLEMAGTS